VLNKNTLEFPFGRGVVSPERAGNISVKLGTSNLQLFLQNSVAKEILDVTPIGSAHITAETETEAEDESSAQITPSDSCQAPKRCIALTYDDGPTSHTPELLATLKRHHAKATFFTVGKNVVKFPDIVKQIDHEGHTIGNHSYSHYAFPSLAEARIVSEITRTNEVLQKTIGKTPKFVRPPYGAVDSKTYHALRQLNMSAILWSVDTRDWADRDSEIVCNRVIAGARPGAIVIMHDIYPTGVRATECILKALKKRSYNFVTVDTLLENAVQPGKGYYRVD
jgi:peptidoglycan/xylan/chitin deacetylase (PgdA/CDA1 family)